MRGTLLFLFTTLWGSATPEDLPYTQIDSLRNAATAKFNKLWQEIAESNEISHATQIDDTQLMEEFRGLTKNFTEFGAKVERSLLEPLTWDHSFAQLMEEIDSMNQFFGTFKRLQDEPVRWRHELAWTDMATYLIEKGERGVNGTLEKIHTMSMMAPGFTLYDKALEDSRSSICELQLSQQELIYQMHNMISLAELKGYTMLQFAWMLLKLYDKGNFKREAEIMQNLYTERTAEKMAAAREAMANADRSLYRCDPKVWREGENYVRLTKLLQGYIENEVNLNSEGTCGQNCKFYDVTEYHGCFKNQFCARQRPCNGEVLHCTYYDSDMNICQSESSDRRYDWVEYENRRTLGRVGSCPARFLHKVDSWWRYLFWHCSYCFCLCDDNHPSSDRFFNLRESKSDVANNKVITGVRLVKVGQVIHIQIQEAPLEPRGTTNKTMAQWVPTKGFAVMDENVRKNEDYFTMNYRERGIDLDDAIAPASHVLTTVRFRKVGGHMNIEIGATPFDFETGKLHSETETKLISNDNTNAMNENPRTEVRLGDPDVPTKSDYGPHLPNSKHDQYLLFRESSQSKDVSQTTVPFIDAQPVESNGLILSGVGLHHRGALDSGGFIAAKLITYDYSSHMEMVAPTNVA